MDEKELLQEETISNISATLSIEIPNPITSDGKSLKEEFVSHTNGTIPMEIFLMALVTLSSFALYAVFRIFIKKLHFENTAHKFGFAIENMLIVLPMLFSFTVLSNDLLAVNLVLNGIVFYLVHHLCSSCYPNFISKLWNCKSSDIKESYLTNYKANIHLTTAICILAVDFNVFPRRFAKAEVYGIGIMDMGVGCIVFSHALTSRQARFNVGVNIACLLSNLKSSAVLVVLGVLRTLLIKEINYQKHVVEYGEHWNFFFTLAAMKPLANFLLLLLNCRWKQPLFLSLSFMTIAVYQLSLSKYGLEGIIQNGFQGDKSRINLIDANREGIFSCIGYLSIYFCGLFFGKQLYKKNHFLYNKLFWLACWCIAGYTCMLLCVNYVTPISRQMANMAYYFIQIAFNSLLLFGFILIDMICFAMQTTLFRKQERIVELCVIPISFLAQCISKNLLTYFLLANVLTGLTNLTFDTLQCSVIKSMGILISYMVLLNNIVWTVFIFQTSSYGNKKFSME